MVYDSQNLSGYCDYSIDNLPVSYECDDVCTPRSARTTRDSVGDCLDTDAGLTGICLLGGEESSNQVYSPSSCTMASCDDTHFCSPLYENGVNDGAGACLLR